MRKPLPQLPLDFGAGEPDASPPQDANGDRGRKDGQYLASAGVGVRVKSYKKPAAAPPMPGADMFGAGQEQVPASDALANPPAESLADLPGEPLPASPEDSPATLSPEPLPTLSPEPLATFSPAHLPVETQASPAARAANRAPAKSVVARKTGPSKRGRKSLKQVTAEADLIEIPADEVLFGKQYYTMGEVSEMFKVNQSLLRYWETEFDILQPRKNKKGDRYFRPVDIKNLHLIYHLLRQKKYTIEGAKDFLRNNKKAKERFEIIERLQQIRNFLLEWKAQL
ncbi:MAG TPA: MerR family transcriptional regulator [Puia sp.]|nr:MerR family transcriptional regulator [Puia sp.]